MDSVEITAITLPLMFLGFAAALVCMIALPFFLHNRTKDRTRLYEMLRQAQESNHPFSPELIRQLVGRRPPSRETDIRRGAILLAIAFGLTIASAILAQGKPDVGEALAVLVLPVISVLGCVGLTLLLLGFTLGRKADD